MPRRQQPVRAVAQPIRNEVAEREAIDKRARRHLDDLERSNYTEPLSGATGNARFRGAAPDDEIGIVGAGAKDAEALKKRKLRPTAVQMLLMYRKNLPTLIKESGLMEVDGRLYPNYLTATAPPSKTPPIRLCEICGFLGKYKCTKCGVFYCEMQCQAIHDETRCERR